MNWYKKSQSAIPFVKEIFETPLKNYIYKTFPKEYNQQQLLMWDLTMDDFVSSIVNKILDIPILTYPQTDDEKPNAHYDAEKNIIEVYGIDPAKYEKDIQKAGYNSYVNSVIFHELVHAVNFLKKLYSEVTYNPLSMGKEYYYDPEEIRAYKAMMKTFLEDYLKLSPYHIQRIMNKYTSDTDKKRQEYLKNIYQNKEPLAAFNMKKWYRAATKQIQVYRGIYTGNENGHYYSTDKEFARQFTQSGQDKEIITRRIDLSTIYDARKEGKLLPEATNENDFDNGMMRAKELGLKGFRLSEGINQPDSIYIF